MKIQAPAHAHVPAQIQGLPQAQLSVPAQVPTHPHVPAQAQMGMDHEVASAKIPIDAKESQPMAAPPISPKLDKAAIDRAASLSRADTTKSSISSGAGSQTCHELTVDGVPFSFDGPSG
jgi:hypothetical protein